MTEQSLYSVTPTIDIYIKLAQYPILADAIRERMRQELYRLNLTSPEQFEREVKELSIASQRREGLGNPLGEEDAQTWQQRKERIRDFHTDALFASNLGTMRLEMLIEEVLNAKPAPARETLLTFNPEIAPWDLLFRQGEIYERLPPEELEPVRHHLEEIKVVLIRRLMSDHLPFIGVARRVLTINDLRRIYHNLIGTGKIGGKASGLILAWRILQPLEDVFGRGVVDIPDSFFIGTDVIYEFFLTNRLEHYMNQKYRPIPEIREEYPHIVADFMAGVLPDHVIIQLRDVLNELGNHPLIVRSSSLLEDNFGSSFAGKYNSYFCPNQGTPEENLQSVIDAIRRIYASTLNPDALLYRKNQGLLDYDERMAILLQRVTGRAYDRYFSPDVAGVAFSRNPFRWSQEIKAEEGFLRLVAGLGTRAVERVAQDYPRLVSLSHPHLRPETTTEDKRRYSQRFLDVIDLETGALTTVGFEDALTPDHPAHSWLVSAEDDEPIETGGRVLSLDGLVDDKAFIALFQAVLQRLEELYEGPVDVEFALDIQPSGDETGPDRPEKPPFRLHVLECRPLARRRGGPLSVSCPYVAEDDTLFVAPSVLPNADERDLRFLVFVDPEKYYEIGDETTRQTIPNTLTQLNDLLPRRQFALIGPGRWGSNDSRLSVPVTYSDICQSRFLIEISPTYNPSPELAFGTDFYEELAEAGIHVLGVQPGRVGNYLNWDLLRGSPNALTRFAPEAAALADCIRVIDLQAVAGRSARLVIDDDRDEAVAFLDAE